MEQNTNNWQDDLSITARREINSGQCPLSSVAKDNAISNAACPRIYTFGEERDITYGPVHMEFGTDIPDPQKVDS